MHQADLAKMLGVSAQTVSNWMSGVRNPGTDAKRRLLELVEKTAKDRDSKKKILGSLLEE